MIKKEDIQIIVNELISHPEFLVDIKVGKANNIQVFVDSLEDFDIDSCKRISRALESKLDRDKEDFQLEVSSPGLDKAFKVIEQYQKYKGRAIDLWTDEGFHSNALLLDVNQDSIQIEYTEYKKKETKTYSFNQIEKAKPGISFK